MAKGIDQMENRILVLVYAPGKSGKSGEPIRGKTVLQKLLFHLGKAMDKTEENRHIVHFYGPFDEQAEVVAEQLEASGLIRIGDGQIKLTERGIEEAKIIWESELTSRQRKAISSLKAYFADLSINEVLAITYAKYPETATNSIVEDQLRQKGKAIAIDLVRRGKVSMDLGARIAGMSLRDFMRELSRLRIPVVERESP